MLLVLVVQHLEAHVDAVRLADGNLLIRCTRVRTAWHTNRTYTVKVCDVSE
jgi:hypothetical protein